MILLKVYCFLVVVFFRTLLLFARRGRNGGPSMASAVLVGLLLPVVIPLLWFCISYALDNGGFEGLPMALAITTIDSTIFFVQELVGYFFTNPVRAMLFVGFLWGTDKLIRLLFKRVILP